MVPLLLAAFAARAGAQCETDAFSPGGTGDFFGNYMVMEGDTAVVAAPGRDSVAGSQFGAAFVYARVGGRWVEQQELRPRRAP